MSSLPDMAATPRKVTLKGKEYMVTALTIDDLADFEVEVKSQRGVAVREALKDADLPPEVVGAEIAKAASKPISLDDIGEFMSSMSGVRSMLFNALQRHQPKLKIEDMGKLVTLDNFDEATKIVEGLGGKAVKEKRKKAEGSKEK